MFDIIATATAAFLNQLSKAPSAVGFVNVERELEHEPTGMAWDSEQSLSFRPPEEFKGNLVVITYVGCSHRVYSVCNI